MNGRGSPRAPTAALLVLSILVLVTIAAGSVSSTRDFGAYNPTWDGTSTLRGWIDRAGGGPNVVLEPSRYRTLRANGTVAFVVAPQSDSRGMALRRFVRRGGTVVVMDDRANRSNDLLASLGADARIDGAALRDERHNYHSPAMPIATTANTTAANDSLVATADRLTLNYGTAIRPNGATTLAATSDFGYRDVNGNGTLDGTEHLDSYPVATVETVGDGRVVVVGDPSIAINSMLSRPGNERFVRDLLAAHDRAVFDYAHGEAPPPFALVLVVLRRSLAAQLALVGALALVALAVRHPEPISNAVSRLSARVGWSRRFGTNADASAVSVDADELAAAIERRYPSWSRDRIERVVAASRAAQTGGEDGD
ncbi:DUF4350 domain-containing protein (plasmid) [Haladaptatus sp. SPP-AMP-3]|uniref:DUF4350 domain-containing protein n=1 Tax=Haladaptatus sp. SPP-AMP-3 TaxID=3121295 RepID=UPI003C2ADA56